MSLVTGLGCISVPSEDRKEIRGGKFCIICQALSSFNATSLKSPFKKQVQLHQCTREKGIRHDDRAWQTTQKFHVYIFFHLYQEQCYNPARLLDSLCVSRLNSKYRTAGGSHLTVFRDHSRRKNQRVIGRPDHREMQKKRQNKLQRRI